MIIKIVRFLVRIFFRIFLNVKISGSENIPKTGGIMLAPNHTSNWDPPFIGSMSTRPVNFMAKSELFNNKFFGWLIKNLGAFPVERGSADVEAVKNTIRLLKDGNAVVLFPHGRRIKQDEDVPIKDGAVMIAVRSRVPILPVYISGEYKFRKKIKITFGKPLDLSEYYGLKLTSERQAELSDMLWTEIKKLNK